jgi:hypothetical protein
VTLQLYFDDDSQEGAVRAGLRLAGIDSLVSRLAGIEGQSDETHLEFALATGRVLVSSNIRDFAVLSRDWLAAGRSHAGIILVKQREFGVGERVRRLARICNEKTPEAMADCVEHLSWWTGPR